MFVNFPTGFGKLLIYQALPLIQCQYNLKGFWPCCCGGFKICRERKILGSLCTPEALKNVCEGD